MKKILPILIIVILLAVAAFFLLRPKEEAEPEPEKKKEPPVVISIDKLPEEQRPVVALTARADGKELKLTVSNLKPGNFESLEYELTYLTEGVQRGVIGSITLKSGEDSITRDLLLGTCSRGKCRYDTNVSGGTLTIKFRGEESYRYSQDFSLETQKGKAVVVMEEE